MISKTLPDINVAYFDENRMDNSSLGSRVADLLGTNFIKEVANNVMFCNNYTLSLKR